MAPAIKQFWQRHIANPPPPPQPVPLPELADPALAPDDVKVLGAEARRLLADPVLALAFQRVEDGLLRAIKNTAPGGYPEREEAYRLYWATMQLKAELRSLIGAATIEGRR